MNLRQYLDDITPEARAALAGALETSSEYLGQLASGHRKPSPKLARRIVQATGERVTLAELRPDIWSGVDAA